MEILKKKLFSYQHWGKHGANGGKVKVKIFVSLRLSWFRANLGLEKGMGLFRFFITGHLLQSIRHKIQSLRNHSFFKMNPKLISSLLPLTCLLLCAMLSLAKFLPKNSWSMTELEYKRFLWYKYYSEIEEYFSIKFQLCSFLSCKFRDKRQERDMWNTFIVSPTKN